MVNLSIIGSIMLVYDLDEQKQQQITGGQAVRGDAQTYEKGVPFIALYANVSQENAGDTGVNTNGWEKSGVRALQKGAWGAPLVFAN